MQRDTINVRDIRNFSDLPASVQKELSSTPLFKSNDDEWEDIVGYNEEKNLYILCCFGSWEDGKFDIESYHSFSTHWEAAD